MKEELKENKILELTEEKKLLLSRLNTTKRELKDLQLRYKELKKRYMDQNDELIRCKIELSKEGYYDIKRSK